MKIEGIVLKNFRNFENSTFEFDRVNIIIGPNGRGKTNLLEAVYFLGNGYSPRLVKTDSIVRWGSSFFYIKGKVKRGEGDFEVEISYKDKKIIKINGKKIKKKIELITKVPMVIFFPQLVDFLFSSPAKRRYFLDREVSKTSLYYYFNLVKYIGLLKRRNAILKKMDRGFENYIDTIDEEIVKIGEHIIDERRRFIEKLNRCLAIFSEIFEFGKIEMVYLPSLEKEKLKKAFLEERKRDIERGYTQKGPHRDDFSFFLNGHDVKMYGSQGERKITVIFTIFSLWRMMKTDELTPILLIDEFSSELDKGKIEKLSGIIERSDGQVFITSLEDIPYFEKKRVIPL